MLEEKVGAEGAVESSTYVRVLTEQADVLPTPSVAVARKVVVEFAGTVTAIPDEANWAALPVPASVVQPASV